MKSKPHKNNSGPAKSSPELVLREQIEKRAHEIWLAAGCPYGDDLSHWLQAESEMQKAYGEGSKGERRSTAGAIVRPLKKSDEIKSEGNRHGESYEKA